MQPWDDLTVPYSVDAALAEVLYIVYCIDNLAFSGAEVS